MIHKHTSLQQKRWDDMGCPYYRDFTRFCITRFPNITNYTSFDTCESEKHNNCLVFNVLEKKFNCKYLESCATEAVKGIPPLVKLFVVDDMTIKLFKEIVQKYCTVEARHSLCANYQSYEKGITPPLELLPNGKKIRISDILLRKEIIID